MYTGTVVISGVKMTGLGGGGPPPTWALLSVLNLPTLRAVYWVTNFHTVLKWYGIAGVQNSDPIKG